MALGTFYCFTCGNQFTRENGEANRTLRKTGYLFCSKTCSGIHRRSLKTTEQKKSEKAEYDRKYRLENKESIKAKRPNIFPEPMIQSLLKKSGKKRNIVMPSTVDLLDIRPTRKSMTRHIEPKKSMASSGNLQSCSMIWNGK